MRQKVQRYCGVQLSGPKSSRTSLVFLDYYVAQQKLFLVDIFDHIQEEEGRSSDAILIEILREFHSADMFIGFGSPLDTPPCVACTKSSCPTSKLCDVPAVKWMRDRFATSAPYLQRPADVYWQDQVTHPVQIHDALGANRAPLTGRALYLRRHMPTSKVKEAEPRLTLENLRHSLHLAKQDIRNARDIENGITCRTRILEKLTKVSGMFVYQRDIPKLARHLSNFDALLTAFTMFLAEHGQCEAPPKGFPENSSWIWTPRAQLDFRKMIAV